MIYLPWVGFILGSAYMIWQGVASKKEYFRRRAEEEAKAAHNAQKPASVS